LRSNTKGYGSKTHLADSQNSDTTAPSGRELYHLQFLPQVASLEIFRYTLVYQKITGDGFSNDNSTHQLYDSNEHCALPQCEYIAATSERYSHFDSHQRQ
jgi:hypothetical protein